jgi:pimeloyl-ACP methyl ester carboxylesterase
MIETMRYLKLKDRFSLRRFTRLLLFAFFIAWLVGISGATLIYTRSLLSPACPPGETARPGYQSVTISIPAGLALKGWWHPSQNGAVVLLSGGLGGNRDNMLPEAELLSRHGFGSLMLEPRTCAGMPSSLGYLEVDELKAMSAFARAQPGVEQLAALGFSIGGSNVILGAAQMPEIRAVVAQGNMANLFQELTSTPAGVLSPQWQIQRLVVLYYWEWIGVWPGDVSPISALPTLRPRPVLLIQGELEAERTHAHEQLSAAGENAQLWIVPGVGHGGYLQALPEEYERRVIEFLNRSLF